MTVERALFGASNYWGSSVKVGSHHLAEGVACRGRRVAYVSDPISPFHLLKPSADLRFRFNIWRHGGIEDLDGSLWAYVPCALVAPDFRGPLKHPRIASGWPSATVPDLSRLLQRRVFASVDLLCIDSLTMAPLAGIVDAACLVYRMADIASGFPGFTPAAARVEEDLATRADLVFCSSLGLLDHARNLGARHVRLLPNGVNFALFSKPISARPPEYREITGPVAVYAGAIDAWLDETLLRSAARALPEVTFVLIGPGRRGRSICRGLSNLISIGPRPYESLPAYLQHADAGLIPFDVKAHGALIEYVRPLKLFEYFAAGIPVVAPAWKEIEALESPARLAGNAEQFAANLKEAIANPDDPEVLRDYARGCDWEKVVDLLLESVESEIGGAGS